MNVLLGSVHNDPLKLDSMTEGLFAVVEAGVGRPRDSAFTLG